MLETWEYIARDKLDATDRVEQEIKEAVSELASQPELGHISLSSPSARPSSTCPSPVFLNHRNVGDGNEFETTTPFVVHEGFFILCNQAVLRAFDPNYVTVVEPQRIGLKRAAVVNVQQRLFCHVCIVPQGFRYVNACQPRTPFSPFNFRVFGVFRKAPSKLGWF
ncbi:MAG: hypothetical protein KIS67_04965 [Verrucomicrobiae bacterium]|nr:hypothetical protein [Verrucomicrobiae bacterium]